MANFMETFLQSDMAQFRLIPLRRINTFCFWDSKENFGTKLVVFWNKTAQEEVKA